VPNVVGRPRVKAEDLVRRAGMRPFSTPQRSPRRRGLVVNQRPKPGTVLADGSVVTLLVSAGPPRAAVPDVVGLAVADAGARLARAGFRAKATRVDSAKQPGTVLKQRPAAKIRAAPGSVVLLTVAKPAAATTRTATTETTVTTAPRATTTRTAPPATTQTTQPAAGTVAVPTLTGKGLGTALTSLEQLGLLAGVKYVSAQAPVGQVRAQNPAAGMQVRPRTRVQLDVSEGTNPGNPTDVPDVTGEDEATARSDLEDAGFRVVVVHRTRGPGESGSVVEQLPSAGTTLSSDDIVAIYVRD
jgi:beta-lactam-binding protein with PASTA domain